MSFTFATPPYSAYLDTILQSLKMLALSPALGTEVTAYKAWQTANTPFNLNMVDANGAAFAINVAPGDGSDLSWIAPEFAQVFTAQFAKLTVPYPVLSLVGMPGRRQTSKGGSPFTTDQTSSGAEGQIFSIDAAVFAGSSDDPNRNQFEAMILCQAFASLVRRNERLGFLVQLIQSTSPVEPLGAAPPARASSQCSVARVRFEVLVLLT